MSAPPARLRDKVCIVTGASSGLGRAIALAFAREGAAYIHCADLRPDAPRAPPPPPAQPSDKSPDATDAADSEAPPAAVAAVPAPMTAEQELPTHELIAQLYGPDKAGFSKVNIAVEADVERMVAETVEKAGRLDVFVNNAGIGPAAEPLHETSDELLSGTLNVNIRGPFLCTKHAVRQFLKQGQNPPVYSTKNGSIVNIASAVGLREIGNSAVYAASKAAVVSLTNSTALQYGRQKIQCNAICPGFLPTPMTHGFFQNEVFNGWIHKAVPWDGGNTPAKGTQEVANLALWLAGEESGWVTGAALPVDGGFSVHAAPFVP